MKYNHPIRLNFILSTLLLCLSAPHIFADDLAVKPALKDATFVMAANRPIDTPWYMFWDLVYTEMFKRLDIKLKMITLPMKRASIMANEGYVDGEVERIYGYANNYPNLIRIEESLSPDNINAYVAMSSDISELNGWDSLKDTNYKVTYVRGSKINQYNLTQVLNKENLDTITNALQGLKMLARNRVDVFIGGSPSVLPHLRNPQFGLHNKIRKAGLMESISLYMYVHKRHQSLVPKFNNIIKDLKTEGLVEEYWDTAFDFSEKGTDSFIKK